jgi:hypothetical protein
MIACLGENALKEMAVFRQRLMLQEPLLVSGTDARNAQVEKLAVVFNLLAELLNLVEPGLEPGINLLLLGPEPEIVPLVPVSAVRRRFQVS